MSHLVWETARAAGFTTFLLLTLSVALGLVLSARWKGPGWPRFVTNEAAPVRDAARARLPGDSHCGGLGRPVHPLRRCRGPSAVRRELSPGLDGPRNRRPVPRPGDLGEHASTPRDRLRVVAAPARARVRPLRVRVPARNRRGFRQQHQVGAAIYFGSLTLIGTLTVWRVLVRDRLQRTSRSNVTTRRRTTPSTTVSKSSPAGTSGSTSQA